MKISYYILQGKIGSFSNSNFLIIESMIIMHNDVTQDYHYTNFFLSLAKGKRIETKRNNIIMIMTRLVWKIHIHKHHRFIKNKIDIQYNESNIK